MQVCSKKWLDKQATRLSLLHFSSSWCIHLLLQTNQRENRITASSQRYMYIYIYSRTNLVFSEGNQWGYAYSSSFTASTSVDKVTPTLIWPLQKLWRTKPAVETVKTPIVIQHQGTHQNSKVLPSCIMISCVQRRSKTRDLKRQEKDSGRGACIYQQWERVRSINSSHLPINCYFPFIIITPYHIHKTVPLALCYAERRNYSSILFVIEASFSFLLKLVSIDQ